MGKNRCFSRAWIEGDFFFVKRFYGCHEREGDYNGKVLLLKVLLKWK